MQCLDFRFMGYKSFTFNSSFPCQNLLVTSTLTMCTEPYPGELGQKHKPGRENKITKENPVPNGVETPVGDGDEEMTDAEASESTDTADTEMQEEKASETPPCKPETGSDSNTSGGACATSEQQTPSTQGWSDWVWLHDSRYSKKFERCSYPGCGIGFLWPH